MPFDFSRFLLAVESRARALRGLSIASRAMTCTSLAALVSVVVIRLLRVPFAYWMLILLALPPVAAALIGFTVGRRRHPRVSHLLLRIDDTLGLDAGLSSLYELRQRTTASVFRQRLEREVRDAVATWQSALPVGRRIYLGGFAGICGIALAVGLAFVPLPPAAAFPFDALDRVSEQPSPDLLPADSDSFSTPSQDVPPPVTIKTEDEVAATAGAPSLGSPERDHTLDDVMRDLTGLAPDEAVLVPVSPDDIEELARSQGEAMRAVAELLESIRDRLADAAPTDPPQLTEEEMEALQRELDHGVPPDLQQGLNELLDPSPTRSVEEIVEDLIDQFGDEEERDRDDGGGEGLPQSTAMSPDQEQIDELMDELGRASADAEEEAGEGTERQSDGDGGPAGDGDGLESPGGPSDVAGERGIEDPDQLGGTDGPGGSSDPESEREPGFIRETVQGNIGAEGDYVSEFVTEGVPIELVPGSGDEEVSFRLDYDRIVSILRERGVPEGAIDIVRNYFNEITEGGP